MLRRYGDAMSSHLDPPAQSRGSSGRMTAQARVEADAPRPSNPSFEDVQVQWFARTGPFPAGAPTPPPPPPLDASRGSRCDVGDEQRGRERFANDHGRPRNARRTSSTKSSSRPRISTTQTSSTTQTRSTSRSTHSSIRRSSRLRANARRVGSLRVLLKTRSRSRSRSRKKRRTNFARMKTSTRSSPPHGHGSARASGLPRTDTLPT